MRIILIVFGIIALLYLFIVPGWYKNYSDGQRTGDVYKFSRKGLFYKSWEGELYLGGLVNNNNNQLEMEKFYFSIPSKEEEQKLELIKKLNICSEKRLKCTVKYEEWLKSPIYQSSGYTVVGVEIPDK